MNTIIVLLGTVLKKKFNLYITTIRNSGQETEEIIKISRDNFISKISDKDNKVVLVEKYPTREEWQIGVFYVAKTGKSVYYKERIGKIINFKED